MIGIYKITSPSKKVYVGQSVDIPTRFATYQRMNCRGQARLYSSFVKYGVNKHSFEIITTCELKDLNELERFYQEIYDCVEGHGLNCQYVKTNTRKYRHSQETKDKIAKSHEGRVYNSGFKLSEDHKKKISEAHKGKKKPHAILLMRELHRQNKVKSFQGKKHSEESKNKISISRKGQNSGSKNHKSKIVLDTLTGVFYESASEICLMYGVSRNSLTRKLSGNRKNTTQYRYV